MNFLDYIRDISTKILGESRDTYYKGGREEHRVVGGLFGEGGLFGKKPQPTSQPLNEYQPTSTPEPYAPQPAVEEYQAQPTQNEYVQLEQQQQPQIKQYKFYDKAELPPQYAEVVSKLPNDDIIASVLAQETGGYGYKVPDPQTGKFVDWDVAKAKNIRGESGEVGIAQIIPKWDEESYAQALYNPTFAIQEAGRIINKSLAVYDGDVKKALGAWNKNPSYPDEVLSRIKR